MRFIDSKTIDVTTLALDGLMKKHKAISANIANAEVAGYKREDVSFEDQLNQILEKEYEQESFKSINSKLPYMKNTSMVEIQQMSAATKAKAIEARQAYGAFKPILSQDDSEMTSANGNTVNVEKEMVELAKNTTKYSVLAENVAKKLQGLQEIIKGVV